MLKDKLRIGLIVGAVVGVVGAVFSYCRPDAFEGLEGVTYDVRARWSANPKNADPRIVMVDVDDFDIEWVRRHAKLSWPWPRELYARVTKTLLDQGARAVVFDLIFEDLGNNGAEDVEGFGKALASAPRTVIGLRLSQFKQRKLRRGSWAVKVKHFAVCGASRAVARKLLWWQTRVFLPPDGKGGCALWIGGEDSLPSLVEDLDRMRQLEPFAGLLKNAKERRELTAAEQKHELTPEDVVLLTAPLKTKIPKGFPTPVYAYMRPPLLPLATSVTQLGVISQRPEADGIFRGYSPLMRYGGRAFPSLALAAAMVAFPERKLRVKNGRLYYGSTKLPVDETGRLGIRYHGARKDAYTRIGIRQVLNVAVQKLEREAYRTKLGEARKQLGGAVLDEQRLPTKIRDTLVTLWKKLEADGCGIRLKHKRLALLKDLSAKDTWHTLRVQWAAAELAKAKAKAEGCNETAAATLTQIKALRAKFNVNYKKVKRLIGDAQLIEYPKPCRAGAAAALGKLMKIMSAKKSQPKKAFAAFQAWEKVVGAKTCKHVLKDTIRRELLVEDTKHKSRFESHPGLKPGDVKGRIFMVHVAAAALRDLKPSPLDPHHEGGIITANFLDNLLHGDFIRRSPKWVSAITALLLCLILALGTFLITGLTRSAAWVSVLSTVISLLVVTIYGFIAYTFYEASGVSLDVVQPSMWGLFAWAGALGTNFYLEGKDRRFVQDALGRYTAPALVKELMSNPKALSLDWGEKRELTVFFSDLQSFTSISERLTAEQLVHLLNDYLTEMTEIILDSGGIVDKYIGDAIMAFWGAPYDDPEHAMNACRATLKMQKRITELTPKWQQEYGETIIARCGLNTGLAVAGNMGSKHKFNYTLMGDTVNLASRFEGANKPYSTLVMIGEATRAVVKDQVLTRELDFMAVKGKERPVRVFELIGLMEEMTDKDEALAERFTEALDVYRQTKFKEAMELFQRINDDYDGDGPSKLYIQRCRDYLRNPPPLDWDGVFRMTTK